MAGKYLKQFVSLFEWLCVADEVMSKSNDKNCPDYKAEQNDLEILKDALKDAQSPFVLTNLA